VFGQLYHPKFPDTAIDELSVSARRECALDAAQAVASKDFSRVASFDGSFALLVWDETQRTLCVCNDRFGTLPLYVSRHQNRTVISTDPSLANQNGVPAQITPSVAMQLYACRYVLDGSTLFQGVRSLLPASFLTITPEEFTEVQYRLPYPKSVRPTRCIQGDPGKSVERQDELGERFEAAVAQCAKGSSHVVVPLSGGLDSRAILGALLAHRDAREIRTFTMGTPGTFDYDIGNLVAHHIGTQHQTVDLPAMPTSADDFTRRIHDLHGLVDPIDNIPWRKMTLSSVAQSNILSGFLGDPLTGSHLTPAFSSIETELSTASRFETVLLRQVNRHLTKCQDIFEPGLDASTSKLVECARRAAVVPDSDIATWMMRWDLMVRQPRYIVPSVMPQLEDATVSLPFTRTAFASFAEELHGDELLDQSLYKAMLLRRYPTLFQLPTKTYHGRSLSPETTWNRVRDRLASSAKRCAPRVVRRAAQKKLQRRMANYYVKQEVLEKDGMLRKAVWDAANSAVEGGFLRKRAIERIWNEHDAGKRDHSLTIVSSAILGTCCEYVKRLNG